MWLLLRPQMHAHQVAQAAALLVVLSVQVLVPAYSEYPSRAPIIRTEPPQVMMFTQNN
jgi:hypothetical protein